MKFFLKATPVLVIIALIIYLMSTSMNEALSFYVTAREFMEDPAAYSGKTLKVAGWVEAGSIRKNPSRPLWLSFAVKEGETRFLVEYEGLPPDTFVDNAEVVVTGNWRGEVFQATEILAKCASKYSEKLTEDAAK